VAEEKLKIIRRPNNSHHPFRLPNTKPSLLGEDIVFYPRRNQRSRIVIAHHQYDDVFAVRCNGGRRFVYTHTSRSV